MYVIGNWKLNGSAVLVDSLAPALNEAAQACPDVTVVACPPDVWLTALTAALGRDRLVSTGGQNCHHETAGAYTGETSALQLAEIGCSYAILGHSERRQHFGETSAQVAAKAATASAAGLQPVVCIGESLEQRSAGRQFEVCREQLQASLDGLAGGWLSNAIIAYEPIWAIGTGEVASVSDVADMSEVLRACLVDTFGNDGNAVSILYGGSVNDKNAMDIFNSGGVQGALVGGASLKPSAIGAIIGAAQACAKQSNR